jgi:hypothetical protein
MMAESLTGLKAERMVLKHQRYAKDSMKPAGTSEAIGLNHPCLRSARPPNRSWEALAARYWRMRL